MPCVVCKSKVALFKNKIICPSCQKKSFSSLPLFALENSHGDEIHQRGENCYLVSGLCAVAERRPDILMSTAEKHGARSIKVELLTGRLRSNMKKKKFVVDLEKAVKAGGLATSSSKATDGAEISTAAVMFENALMQAIPQSMGGGSGMFMQALTGGSPVTQPISEVNAALLKKIWTNSIPAAIGVEQKWISKKSGKTDKHGKHWMYVVNVDIAKNILTVADQASQIKNGNNRRFKFDIRNLGKEYKFRPKTARGRDITVTKMAYLRKI